MNRDLGEVLSNTFDRAVHALTLSDEAYSTPDEGEAWEKLDRYARLKIRDALPLVCLGLFVLFYDIALNDGKRVRLDD